MTKSALPNDASKLPLLPLIRITIWVWLFYLILPLVPKQAIKTLTWITEMPND